MSSRKKIELGYPVNLISDIFGERHTDDFVINIISRKSIITDIEMAIKTLTDKERYVLKLRYINKETLESIGNKIGNNRERARQIIEKSLRKMRHPYRSRYIKYGVEEVMRKEYEAKMEEIRIKKEEERIKEEIRIAESKLLEEMSKSILYKKIYDIGLSARAWHCLIRKGINTFQDLLNYVNETNDEGEVNDETRCIKLLEIKNLGMKSAEEVLNTIKNIINADSKQV